MKDERRNWKVALDGYAALIINQSCTMLSFFLDDLCRLQLAIPKAEDGSYDKCSMYNVDFVAMIKKGIHVGNSSWPRQKCFNGYEYDRSEIPFTTIATEVSSNFDRKPDRPLASYKKGLKCQDHLITTVISNKGT